MGTYLIILPFAAAGITDRIMIYGGAPLTVGQFQPYYLGSKVQVVRTPEVQASIGTLAFVYDDDVAGIAFGVGTFGSEDRAFSAGLGYFYSGDDVLHEPALMFGAENRVSRRMKLISENYVLPEAVGVLFSGGVPHHRRPLLRRRSESSAEERMEVEPAVSRSSTSTIRSGDDRQRAAFTGPDGGVPIPYPVAEALVIALAVYGAAGAVFAVPFALRGRGRHRPRREGGDLGVSRPDPTGGGGAVGRSCS